MPIDALLTEPISLRLPFFVSNRLARDTPRDLTTHLLRPLPYSGLWVGAKPLEGLLKSCVVVSGRTGPAVGMDVALQGQTQIVAFTELVQKATDDGMEQSPVRIVAFRGENWNALRRKEGAPSGLAWHHANSVSSGRSRIGGLISRPNVYGRPRTYLIRLANRRFATMAPPMSGHTISGKPVSSRVNIKVGLVLLGLSQPSWSP